MNKNNWIILLCILPVFLSAQTAAEIEEILAANAVNYQQAARLALKAADLPAFMEFESLPNGEEAFNYAADKRWLPKRATGSGKASLEGVSLLIMGSFNIKGGLLYSLFRNPHYAYREMVYQDIIQGRADPGMNVSGEQLLFLINRVLSLKGDDIDYDIDGTLQELAASEIRPQETLVQEKPVELQPALAQERPVELQPTLVQERPVEPQPALALQPRSILPLHQPLSQQKAEEQEAMAREINAQLKAKEVIDATATVTNEGITISLSNIQFMANSAELPESEKRKLQGIAGILQTIPEHKILVTGHTALAGTQQDQMQTSYDRARAVASYLIILGARRSNEIFAQGFGAERPIADNSTPQGMALNRRVEITILE